MISALLTAAAIAAAPVTPAAPKAEMVELGDVGGRLRSVRLVVNGQEGLFTVDTGGGVSLISPAFAERIGCKPWAAHTGFRLTGERLDMPRCERVQFALANGRKLAPVAAGVLDLQPLLWPGAPAVDGSIALDAFEGRVFDLDLGTGTLRLHPAGKMPPAAKGAIAVPIRETRQAGGAALVAAVPVNTGRGRLWMALDSGGGAPILVRDKVAAELSLDPAGKGAQPVTLTIAGEKPVSLQSRAIVRDMISDGVIGLPSLVRWKLRFDLVRNLVWFAPAR